MEKSFALRKGHKSTAIAVVLWASVAPQMATAFGTVNGLGQAAEHEHITRYALKDEGIGAATLARLAGQKGSLGAIGAPDDLTGDLVFVARAHCDNGDNLAIEGYPQAPADAQAALEACRGWIDGSVKAAVAAAGGLVSASGVIQSGQLAMDSCAFKATTTDTAKCEVLENLGFALHAAQDFYAHSNWVDQAAGGGPSPTNPPGLGKTGAAPWLSLRQTTAFPTGLITGCFVNKPEAAFCNYGLTLRSRVKHAALNKDTGPISDTTGATGHGTSDRGAINNNFERAVGAAAADTRDKWRLLAELIKAKYPGARGDKITCVLRADTPAGC